MADFSNPTPDPFEAARRRYGFPTLDDLSALNRLVALAAGSDGVAGLLLEDSGGVWYEHSWGTGSGTRKERRLSSEGTDLEGLLWAEGPVPEERLDQVAAVLDEVLRIRRMSSERRRQPRGPEGASFVPGMVHELRNFLFAMGAGLDAFEARFEGKDQGTHGRTLRGNLSRLQTFMEELSEYGNPGALAFALQPLVPVLQQVRRLIEPIFESRNLNFVFIELTEETLERMDRSALERALVKLVHLVALEVPSGGGVSFTPRVLETTTRPWLEILICGKPARSNNLDPDRLFEPFHYRDKDMSKLGPAISRRTIEAHGGQLAALKDESGLSLRVLLPVWKTEGLAQAKGASS